MTGGWCRLHGMTCGDGAMLRMGEGEEDAAGDARAASVVRCVRCDVRRRGDKIELASQRSLAKCRLSGAIQPLLWCRKLPRLTHCGQFQRPGAERKPQNPFTTCNQREPGAV